MSSTHRKNTVTIVKDHGYRQDTEQKEGKDKTRNKRKVKKMNTIIDYDMEKVAQDRERESAIISMTLNVVVYGETLDYIYHGWNAWYKECVASFGKKRKYQIYDALVRDEILNQRQS